MDLKYPIGKFQFDGEPTTEDITGWIDEIEEMPKLLRAAVEGLSEEQVNTPYRPGGWTVRQVVHHLADSQLNFYIRFRWAVTEENPLIKAYDQQKWVELVDYRLPVEASVALLEALNSRWTYFLRNLTPSQLKKTFIHPESGNQIVANNIGNYAWHGKHHVAHITSLIKREGWWKLD